MHTASARDTTYQLRIDATTKREAFAVFHELGMTPAEGLRVFLRMVAKTKSIPFSIHIPNEKTTKMLLLDDADKGYKRFDTIDALFADLNDECDI